MSLTPYHPIAHHHIGNGATQITTKYFPLRILHIGVHRIAGDHYAVLRFAQHFVLPVDVFFIFTLMTTEGFVVIRLNAALLILG